MCAVFEFLQALCPVATICLTGLVAWRDTKHMHKEETRRREADMLSQPSSVAAWLECDSRGLSHIVIRNDSDLPIYEVVVTVVITKGHGCTKGEDLKGRSEYRKKFALIPPGLYIVDVDMNGFGGMHRFPLIEIGFICANGRSWVRRGNGSLDQIDSSPILHFELGLPVEFDPVVPYQIG